MTAGGHHPRAKSALAWRLSYFAFAIATSVFSLHRMLWAWPDAAWQTTLSDIAAVDRVLNNGLGGQLWIGVGGEHALTGYRWFQYVNAEVFGLNAQVELYAYFSLTLTLALVIGARIFRDLDRGGAAWPPRLLAFAIPAILSSLVGAGSRGMEIGQFTGITLFVVLTLLIETRISTRTFVVVTLCTVPAAAVLVLGSYTGAPAIALTLVSLLQIFRPTMERGVRAKLFVLSGTFLASIAAWVVLMVVLPPAELNGRFGQFFQQVSHDPAFVIKYLLGGAAGSVISAQTLEVSGHGSHYAYFVGVFVVLFVAICVLLAYRHAWAGSTVPLLLVLMPVCLAGILMVGRGTSALWMLSPWYGFPLRLFVVGGIWLLVRALARVGVRWRLHLSRTLLVVGAAGASLIVVLAVSVTANVDQWRREPSERAYFQRVQLALLFPQQLSVNDSGLTQLILPLDQSRRAIELLRKDHLSVYRDPQAVLAAMGHKKPYDAAAAAKPVLSVNGMLDDTWAGQSVEISVLTQQCDTLHVNVTPFPAVVHVPAAAGVDSTLTLVPSFGTTQEISLGASVTRIQLHPSGQSPEVVLSFSRTWNPAALGLGADKRDLSALVEAACS